MSWSIHAEGTPDEVRAEIREHEDQYWRHMPVTERLLVHHVLGHAVTVFEEANGLKPMTLHGNGHEGGGSTSMRVDAYPQTISGSV